MDRQEKNASPVEVKKQEYASQIETWKRKYGKVRMCLIEDEKAAFFRLPTRAEMQCAENLAFTDEGKFDAHKKAERLIADCFLGGDLTPEQINADIEVYTPLSRYVITKLVEEKKTVSTDC
jgi:hypothetical protein